MNNVQTVTLNNAPSQNWVGCTVRTPRTQVARTLRAQCPCRGHCYSHNKLIARAASAGRAHTGCALFATRPGNLPPGRDLTSMSRHQGSQNHVATSNRCRDTTQNTPGRNLKFHVATLSLLPSLKPGRDTRTRSRPPGRPTYVATSFSCHDLVPAQHEISRSRHQSPGRDLPRCYPCRDLKMMSRLPAQSSQFQPGRDVHFWSRPHAQPSQVADIKTMSRPQTGANLQRPLIPFFFFFFKII